MLCNRVCNFILSHITELPSTEKCLLPHARVFSSRIFLPFLWCKSTTQRCNHTVFFVRVHVHWKILEEQHLYRENTELSVVENHCTFLLNHSQSFPFTFVLWQVHGQTQLVPAQLSWHFRSKRLCSLSLVPLLVIVQLGRSLDHFLNNSSHHANSTANHPVCRVFPSEGFLCQEWSLLRGSHGKALPDLRPAVITSMGKDLNRSFCSSLGTAAGICLITNLTIVGVFLYYCPQPHRRPVNQIKNHACTLPLFWGLLLCLLPSWQQGTSKKS